MEWLTFPIFRMNEVVREVSEFEWSNGKFISQAGRGEVSAPFS